MSEASIPVDLFNPGQVFACLGFLEAAEVLLGNAEGGFDWSNPREVRFRLTADGGGHPFEAVLRFLAGAVLQRITPVGFVDPPATKSKDAVEEDDFDDEDDEDSGTVGVSGTLRSDTFPAATGDATSLPILLRSGDYPDVTLGHWADGSSRNTFKLYSGNRSAEKIAHAMFAGTRHKPKKNQTTGDLKTRGINQLWAEQRVALIEHPFHLLTPLGGSFNLDPRGGWTAIDAGYSPNKQKHPVASSPAVQILAAWGLEHTRPFEFGIRQVRYAAWGEMLPPMLARVAFQSAERSALRKAFRFELALNGKNKVVTFSQLESMS